MALTTSEIRKMFTTLNFEKETTHKAHGYLWEIRVYKVQEKRGSYKIFISTLNGEKGNAIFVDDIEDNEEDDTSVTSLLERAKQDIDINDENKYAL